MIRFVHTADIHFGMENYGRIDAKTGIHTRLLDFKKALDSCISYAIETKVDLFVFAGDAYKTHHPSQTHQKLLMDCFMRLHHADIPVIIVVGNHDHPVSFGKAHALDLFSQLPVNTFHVFAKPDAKTIYTKNGPINIVGMPWPTRNTISLNNAYKETSHRSISDYISHAMASIIEKYAQNLDSEIPALLVGHLTVSSGIFSGSEKQAIYGTDPLLLPSQLAIEPFDYVALGHLHRYQNLNPNGYPAVIYSGSIERIDFGERKEEKGFCVVTIHAKGNTTHEFIPIKTRPFLQVEVVLDDQKPQTEQIIKALSAYDLNDAIVKIIYHLPPDVADKVQIKVIQDACKEALVIANILPIRHATRRERRIQGASTTQDLPTLLQNYFTQNNVDEDKKNRLLKKTLALLEEIHTQKNESHTQ
jgi:DNA repair protein SbcD/Mre11